jgi:hypothetical protein
MRMRRLLVVLAALLALSNAPAYAATRRDPFSTAPVACVSFVSEKATPQGSPKPSNHHPESSRHAVPAPLSFSWAETDIRFQRPPPAA